MKTTVNFYEFSRWFEQNRPDNFSRAGITALFDYFEEFEDSTGESIEFDPIAICCEYTEYEDIAEFHQNYDEEDYPTIDELYDYTQVIPFGTESFIILDF
tara:strand:+ start:242 stop:541 length:300 start_codon:yes stop_codon:yes gene_type:complete